MLCSGKMRVGVIFFLASFLFASSALGARLLSTSASTSDSDSGAEKTFDYFLFVQENPSSYCAARGSCPLVHVGHSFKFTIHGLWPDNNDGSYPQFCDNTAFFHEDVLRDILPEMREAWPSYFENNDEFWQHEWAKHGTCALSTLNNEKDFFSTVLDLHRKYDLAAALAAKDIVPSATAKYTAADVRGAIVDMYHVGSMVHCDAHGQLTEVWLCLTRSLKPMDCPRAEPATQCREVRIPLMPSSEDDDSTQTDDEVEADDEWQLVEEQDAQEGSDVATETEAAEEEEEARGGNGKAKEGRDDDEHEEEDDEDEEEEDDEEERKEHEEEDEEENDEDEERKEHEEDEEEDDEEEDDEEEEESQEQEGEDEDEDEETDELLEGAAGAQPAAPKVHAGLGGSGAAVSQLHWLFPLALLVAGLGAAALVAGLLVVHGRQGKQQAAPGRRQAAEVGAHHPTENKPLLP